MAQALRALAGLALTFLLTALPAQTASATCALPGIYPDRWTVSPGDTIRVQLLGWRGWQCNDTFPMKQTEPPGAVRIYLDRPGTRIEVGRTTQRTTAVGISMRVPLGILDGPWRLRTSSGLASDRNLRVLPAVAHLPYTGNDALVWLSGLGCCLLVAGAQLALTTTVRLLR